MTLSTIAEIIAERQGKQFDVPFRKLCEDLIVAHRARILTNSLSKNPTQKRYFSNSIIMDLKQVNKDECEEVAECGCDVILRTVEKVPQSLRVGSNPYDFVGSPGGVVSYSWTSFAAERYLKHSTYTGKLPRYTLLNDYIYIFVEKNAEKIRVEDVFSDPRKLSIFKCSTEDSALPCYSESSEFIADEAMVQLVIESVLTKEFSIKPEEEKIEVKTDKVV